MIYLAANHASIWRRRDAGLPMGWCMSPAGWRRPVKDGHQPMPYAIDNGMYHPPEKRWPGMSAFPQFYAMLDRASEYHPPLFVVAIDRPYRAGETRELFPKHQRHIRNHLPGATVAMAVQDGMAEQDLDLIKPPGAVFVGGSTEWKWSTMSGWMRAARERGLWGHVARVNTIHRVRQCRDEGADSVDGTGIFRGDRRQLMGVLSGLTEGVLFGTVNERGT